MKKISAILSIILTASTVFAIDEQPIKETATQAALALSKANWAYMGNRLDLQVFQVTEKDREVKVELGIGSVERPAKMHDCVTVSFDENGFIKHVSNEIDSDSCE